MTDKGNNRIDSIVTRGTYFAFLFGPPKFLSREDGSNVHGAVCEALGFDDFSFQYSLPDTPNPKLRWFSIVLNRKEGRGGYKVELDNKTASPIIRLHMAYERAPGPSIVSKYFNATSEAVFEKIEGPWKRVVAEVRIRAQCMAPGGDGMAFIKNELLQSRAKWSESLGVPLIFGSVRLLVAAGSTVDGPLANPRREMVVEVLREDPSSLYLELVSSWPQFPDPVSPGAPIRIDPASARSLESQPGEFVEEAHIFLRERLKDLMAIPEG